MISENRVKIFLISPEELVRWWNYRNQLPNFISYPEVEGIPEGARVVSIWYDPARRKLNMLVFHESFEEIEVGAVPPVVLDILVSWKTVIMNRESVDEPVERALESSLE